MKKLFLFLYLLFIPLLVFGDAALIGLESNQSSGNNFSNDSNCVAVYNLENGALTTDSKSTNTLTNYNSVIANLIDYRQGLASADFELGDDHAFNITDANLAASFPFKSSGGGGVISICMWVQFEAIVATDVSLAIKWKYSTLEMNWRMKVEGDDNKFVLHTGYGDGTSYQSVSFGTGFSLSKWYHIAFTLDEDDNYFVRIWDRDANDYLDSDLSGTFGNAVAITDAPMTIGGQEGATSPTNWSARHDGEMDEIVIFKDELTGDEIDQIRKGIYGN